MPLINKNFRACIRFISAGQKYHAGCIFADRNRKGKWKKSTKSFFITGKFIEIQMSLFQNNNFQSLPEIVCPEPDKINTA